MKKIICLLLILAMLAGCLALSGCDAFKAIFKETVKGIDDATEVPYEQLGGADYSDPAGRTPIESRYAYSYLSEGQKKLYDGIIQNIYQVYPEQTDLGLYKSPQVIVDDCVLDTADIRVTLRAITDDNPYLFWLSRTFSHMTNEDEVYTAVQCYSSFSPDALREMRSKLDKVIDDFNASVPEGLSDYELEKFAHDYIIEHCAYDTSYSDHTEINEQNIKTHSVYGGLVDGLCVCEGYGMSFQLLLNGMGVECVTVTGMAYDSASDQHADDAVLHLWNAVKLDGDWYLVDCTWDDQEYEHQRYNYFNLDDSLFGDDHTPSDTPENIDKDYIAEKGTEDMNLFIPVCDSKKYNYFVYDCPHLTYFDSSDPVDAIYAAALEKRPFITMYIDPDYLDYDEAIDMLFNNSPQYCFMYMDEVNSRLSGYEIDENNLKYYINESRRYVTVALYYY